MICSKMVNISSFNIPVLGAGNSDTRKILSSLTSGQAPQPVIWFHKYSHYQVEPLPDAFSVFVAAAGFLRFKPADLFFLSYREGRESRAIVKHCTLRPIFRVSCVAEISRESHTGPGSTGVAICAPPSCQLDRDTAVGMFSLRFFISCWASCFAEAQGQGTCTLCSETTCYTPEPSCFWEAMGCLRVK